MYIDAQTIIKAGSLLAALTAFVTLTWKLFKWIDHQKEQDVEIANLKAQGSTRQRHCGSQNPAYEGYRRGQEYAP